MAKGDLPSAALDTSVVVALVATWHEHHWATVRGLEALLDAGHALVVPGTVLIESYSVLTRLPSPKRLSPDAALSVLQANFRNAAIPSLGRNEIWGALRDGMGGGVSGGRIHDWIIASSATKANAGILVTWNLRHFKPFETVALKVVTPEDPVPP